jgi:uncharacterized protein (TIGR03083 family)
MNSAGLLVEAYRPIIDLAKQVDESQGWTPSLLPGWTVRDLLLHLASDSQRALVALATPSLEPADTDEVSYWSDWMPGTDSAQAGLRGTRIMASAWTWVRGPADLYVETVRAVMAVAAKTSPEAVVTTQSRNLTVDSLLRTLAVEAAVHQLDLEPVLPDPPAASVLAEVRRTLDRLLGSVADVGWTDVRYIPCRNGSTAHVHPRARPPLDLSQIDFRSLDELPLIGADPVNTPEVLARLAAEMTHVVHPRRSRQFRTFVQLGSIHELCVLAGEGLARGWAVLP